MRVALVVVAVAFFFAGVLLVVVPFFVGMLFVVMGLGGMVVSVVPVVGLAVAG